MTSNSDSITQAVPLQFLHALLAYLGDTVSNGRHSSILKSPLASHPNSFYPGSDAPSEGIVRWQLRLEYFAYETLQDLRIAKLFEIIVDYPDRCFLYIFVFLDLDFNFLNFIVSIFSCHPLLLLLFYRKIRIYLRLS